MSIIYDALKKAEGNGGDNKDNKDKEQQGEQAPPSPNAPIRMAVLGALAIVILLGGFFALRFVKNMNIEMPAFLQKEANGKKKKILPRQYNSSEYVLEGIIYDEDDPSAIINGKILYMGDQIGDFTIVEMTPTTVTLRDVGNNISLNLVL